MSGERIDYGIERQRHEGFVGRVELLDRLDQLLTADDVDRWVVVTGGPGMGKSALLATWLARREAAGAVVPHHFIRRDQYGWDEPTKVVGSLVAQIEEHFPGVQAPEEDARMHPAARLASALGRASASELTSSGRRLVVLVDGLDEYDPPSGAPTGDPLAAFLPHALPRGVSFLCASRPRHPYVDSLAARDGALTQLDLDEPDRAADNEATVRAFWEQAAPRLGLDPRFVDEAVARASGNLQHAAMLRQHLAGLPAAQRRVEDIPRGLAALLAKSWQRIAAEPLAARGLGILCAAREALTLDELGAVAGWTDEVPRLAFVRGARELLLETRRPDGQEEYRLHHESIRAHIARALGAAALRAHHGALAQRLAIWPPVEATARRYTLRHALRHRVEAGEWTDAWRLAADVRFLEAKCRELGVHEAEADVAYAAERCRASGQEALCRRFDDLARALGRESHWLRAAPEATPALLWNRLRRSGWSTDDLDQHLQVPAEPTFLRVRHVATRESPALVRDLVEHTDSVLDCVVTADGARVISASADQTLKIWDTVTGRALATLRGHSDRVLACAVTADGARVVSASADRTLKVWDTATGRALATLEGHSASVLACAVTADGARVVSASMDRTLKVWHTATGIVLITAEGHSARILSCAVTADGARMVSASADRTLKVWDLVTGRTLATLEGHSASVLACAVTADGRRVISASEDHTLKVWDLVTGRTLATLEGHSGWVRACAVTADGGRVISASEDRTLKVWDTATGRALATLEGHSSWVLACAVTADGGRVVSASADRMLKIWDTATQRALAIPEAHAASIRACASVADGGRAVSASEDGTLKVWDTATGRVLATLVGHSASVRACAVTADGGRVISASEDRTLKIWDLATGRALATLVRHHDAVIACAVTADGSRVVSASHDGTLRVWDTATRDVLAKLRSTWVIACTVTTDGSRVVSASAEHTLKVWDTATGRVLATLKGHSGPVLACVVTADGSRVVSASKDRTVKVWDLTTGRALATLGGHTSRVLACAVTADGEHVVSVSKDRTLKVWDLRTHACLFTHRGDTDFLAVAATPKGIVAGDASGAVWFLDWPLLSNSGEPPLRVSHAPERGSHSDVSPPRSPKEKHTILFLAANPSGTDRLALDREARSIQRELEIASFRDRFHFETRWAAAPLDLLHELRKLKPTVVHFSGHGGRSMAGEHSPDPHRDIAAGVHGEQRHGLFMQGPDGRVQFVSAQALQQAFGAAGSSVKLVVLNACYSEVQADALLAHVDCVVGMSGSIHDDAARSFAIGFYGGLGERESIAAAHAQGRAAISLEGLHDSDLPQLKVRAGVDPTQIVLAADPR